MVNYFFQIVPIVLAIVSVLACSYRASKDRRKSDRIAMLLSMIASILLIIAQTSWWVTYAIEGDLLGTVFANHVWTIFNSLVMIIFIIKAQPWRTYD